MKLSEALILPEGNPAKSAILANAIEQIQDVCTLDLPMAVCINWIKISDFGGTVSSERFTSLQINAESETLSVSLFHELGHILDRDVFGSELGLGTWIDVAILDQVMQAIYDSKQYTKLWQAFEAVGFKENIHEEYIIRSEELFARAFAQFLVASINTQELWQQLNVHQYGYWDADDFQPIYHAFRELLHVEDLP